MGENIVSLKIGYTHPAGRCKINFTAIWISSDEGSLLFILLAKFLKRTVFYL